MAKTRRSYTGASVSTITQSDINASGTNSFTVESATNWPYGADPFYVVLSPGTASEEKILVTRTNAGDTTLNISSDVVRGLDGTSAVTHGSGATVYPVFTAVDADEANELASMWEAKGDIVSHGASTFARLAVGSDDTVLIADASASSGLAWGKVNTANITNDAVTNAKIATGAVGTTELANDAVTNEKIDAGAVGTTEIAAGAVEYDNLDSVVQLKFPQGIVGNLSASGSYTSDALRDSVTVTATNRLMMIVVEADDVTQWEVRRSGAGTLIRTDKTNEIDVFGSGTVRMYVQSSNTTYELWNDGSTGGFTASGVAYIVDLGPS